MGIFIDLNRPCNLLEVSFLCLDDFLGLAGNDTLLSFRFYLCLYIESKLAIVNYSCS